MLIVLGWSMNLKTSLDLPSDIGPLKMDSGDH